MFGAGEYYGEIPDVPHGACVIAADGGLDHARGLGLVADVVVGDFDSLVGGAQAARDIVRLPAEKDDSDMLSALKIGWKRGSREFHIYGGLGARIDHTISNIQLMALLAQRGGIGFLHGDGSIVTAISDGELRFDANQVAPRRMVSVFSHSDVSYDVNEPGLKYQLKHATLHNTVVQGVSNEFLPGQASSINVHDGTLIITFPTEAPKPEVAHYRDFAGDLGELDGRVSSVLATQTDP